jgi:general secretion pathway protein D
LSAPLIALAILAGCTSHSNYRQGEIASQLGHWDDAVLYYMKAVDNDPGNISYQASLLRAKIKASQEHFEKGKEFEKAGVVERALVEYQQAVQLDPTNQYAQAQLEHAHRQYVAQKQGHAAETIEQMKQKARGARPQPPVLNPRSNRPISLEFPQPVSLFSIYTALARAFGINVLFDPNLRDQELAVDLKDVTAQSALETLMRASGQFYKVMDEHSIIIAQDTPQNRRTYEDLVIQTFFLSNAEVKDMLTILRSLIDARKIATNEQLNAIILRDTADKVKVAERIIEANDKSKAEVVVDIELLQINSQRLRDLGVSLSSYSIGQQLSVNGSGATGTGTGGSTTPSGIRLSDLQFINQANWFLTLPNFVYNFVKTNTDAQLLAKPQLRISEGEKANLVIGDRVPIPLTTFNTQNAGTAGGIVPITSFQYQDVGIKIEIEPRVHHNQEVTLKLKIEVSNLNGNVSGSNGESQPIIGTRMIDSVIRLQDGETNFLAGLIRTDESKTDRGIPGLSEIPLLGRLFSNKRNEGSRTDVILTLTPHIVRNAEITAEDLAPIWVGTEQNITFRGGSPRVESEEVGPFDNTEGTPEEIQDAIRRRLQRLPRGLRPGENGEEPVEGAPEQAPTPPPGGVNLVPVAPPTSIFQPSQPATPPPSDDEQPPGGGGLSGSGSGAAPGGLVSRGTASGTAALSSVRAAALSGGDKLTTAVAAAANTASNTANNPAPAVRLWLVPGRLAVSAGDTFEVRVQAQAGQPVSHLPLSLSFDPKVLAVEKVEAGDFLGSPAEAQLMSDDARPGALVIGASRLGKVAGVKGTGTVARITFRAVAAGSSELGFEGKALDASLRPMAVRTRPAVVEVGGSLQRPDVPATPRREASVSGRR